MIVNNIHDLFSHYSSSDQRDGRDLVQVSLKDLKCLSPGEYLTSPVINFYIR